MYTVYACIHILTSLHFVVLVTLDMLSLQLQTDHNYVITSWGHDLLQTMEAYTIHRICSRLIENLSDELKDVYPCVRVKFTLERKTYGSSFWLKIQTRKKCHRREYYHGYMSDTVQV